MSRLKAILKNYGEVPYILVISAINAPGYWSQELQSLPNNEHRMTVNDSAWILRHLYEMAQAHPQLLEEFKGRH